MARHWKKIGVELEGGWDTDPREFLAYSHLIDVKNDRSVNNLPTDYDGEVTVGPYDRLNRLFPAMLHCYPEAVNSTCGFHVHTSMEPETAARLSAPAFFKHFERFWTDWGKAHSVRGQFWKRLRGYNEYCQRGFDPNDRYQQVNFASYREHGTIECRLLPMFRKSELAVKATVSLILCYHSYLSDQSVTGDRAPEITPSELGKPRDSTVVAQERAKKKLEDYKRVKNSPPPPPPPPPPQPPVSRQWCDNCRAYHY